MLKQMLLEEYIILGLIRYTAKKPNDKYFKIMTYNINANALDKIN